MTSRAEELIACLEAEIAKRDEDIPESTCIPPHQMDRPRAIELAVTAGLLIAIFAWEWLK